MSLFGGVGSQNIGLRLLPLSSTSSGRYSDRNRATHIIALGTLEHQWMMKHVPFWRSRLSKYRPALVTTEQHKLRPIFRSESRYAYHCSRDARASVDDEACPFLAE